MRIGYDAKRAFHNYSGLGNYSRDIIRIVSRQFPEHEYFLYNPKMSGREKVSEGENIHIRYPSSFWKMVPGLWRQIGIHDQLQLDRIDLYHGLSGEITRKINRSVTRTVVTIHDLISERFPELYKPADRKIYRAKMQYAVRNSDRIIAISEQTKKDIITFLDAREDKIIVHYQGCHQVFKEMFSPEVKEAIRAKWTLPREFILTVGTLEKRKNVLFLLEAIKDLPYHLVLVGKETSYTSLLKTFIRDHNMHSRVHFIQGINMEELAILYQAATLFCYPSVFEGFGIPIIEALYSKTPVITSEGGCFAEAGGPGSLYITPGNIAQLKTSLDWLMQTPEKRKEMEEEGFLFVQKFNDEQVGEGLMKIYSELL